MYSLVTTCFYHCNYLLGTMAGLNACKTDYEFILSVVCFINCYVQQRGLQRSICKFIIMIILYRFHVRLRCKPSQITKAIIVPVISG